MLSIIEIKLFVTIFTTIFLAELGDKTQFATMLFATDKAVSKWLVFFAAASALVLASGIGVLLGSVLSNVISAKTLSYIAGTGFILIGCYTLYRI